MSRNMPGRPRKLPSYCHHKASGQAVVRIDGKDRYLGPYGSPASYEKYHRLISERFPHGPDSSPLSHPSPGRDLTMIELMAGYWQHVVKYYVKNDKPTSEQNSIRAALKPIKELYGHEFCHRFGPLALRTVRNKMIDDGITRTRINQHVGRIRRMFKWAVANELLGVETYQTLTALDGLSKGRSDAKESDPVKPVPIEHVEAVLPFLTPQVRAMVQLQRFLACRPEEVARIRPCDVDRSIDPWVYTPETHKTEHHDKERRISIGKSAQQILAPWLDRNPDSYCFSPREARESFNAERRRNRKTPLTPSSRRRKRKKTPKRLPGLCGRS